MKKYIYITFFALTFLAFQNLKAQDKHGRDRIKALKVAFITERLSLTTDEAAKFWPVYNAYEDRYLHLKYGETKKIRNEFKGTSLQDIPEEQAQKLLDKFETVEDQMYTERKKLISDLRKVISARKIILLRKAEDDFYKEMLTKLKDQHRPRN